MILLIDNYDSFTFNLYQYIGELGEGVKVCRNDKISIGDIRELSPSAIVLSPGPGKPEEAGVCIDIIRELHRDVPILGICLGHQAIVKAFGGTVRKSVSIRHGKTSTVIHTESGLFRNLPKKIEVMRYHSLAAEKSDLPGALVIDAVAEEDGEIMAVHHRDFPVYGIQFHPESIGTPSGKQIIENFLNGIERKDRDERILASTI
ncbi:aminodeoxychorismate/anthranilate synthase component II [Neobacillus piezotolerans]|uniref:Aminodeoxychorismate/anthranilate synthase component II n=1 Tax=Neobacillus piezotolerans TaxID=2259171 RepID=A0A3D8GR03_9BACI|nr:aminodeoxychorismate/anthranilate synthase component II [Neobacillus piezotolerans]RDU36476.1 aminodeoxychorismate/anthranilate synthase component II [Neobacillus piezotolerans]